MLLARIATAAAASALLAGAAMAQDSSMAQNPNDTQPMDRGAAETSNTAGTQQSGAAMQGSMQGSADMSSGTMATQGSMSGQTAMSADQAGMNASSSAMTGGATQVVTNGPVADTPENRAKYRPLSNSGRRTAPAGN